MKRPLGVGIIGAGPVAQAVHLPVITSLSRRLEVVHVMDVDATLASAVASRVNARASTEVEELLKDQAVEVVAICSPNRFHAEQIVMSVEAQKLGILCEKPLATSIQEVEQITVACSRSSKPLVVGTMHAYDPAWLEAVETHHPSSDSGSLIRSVMLLPSNNEFINLATQLTSSEDEPTPDRGTGSDRLTHAILQLATHAIPQIRYLAPELTGVDFARFIPPFGYQMVLDCGSSTVELLAYTSGAWQPDWTFEVWGSDWRVHVSYPPSYVLAGSATARIIGPDCERVWRTPLNGYQTEWLHLADVVENRVPLRYSIESIAGDMRFALDIVDGATTFTAGES